MKTIYFKSAAKKAAGAFSQPTGWIALGDHAVDGDGTHLLSSGCVSVREVESQAAYLKHLSDSTVEKAKAMLTN